MAGGAPATGMGWVRQGGGSYRVGGAPAAPGWTHTPLGSYRTSGAPHGGPAGGAPWAPPRATPGRASSATAAWTPPPLPTGSYNPQRDIETEESGRGLGQLQGEVGTARSRDTADYFTQKGEIERQAGQQKTDFEKAQQLLKQSYARLGSSQEQGANKLGVLQGGALLQAAAKRSANEGQESQKQQTDYQRQQDATNVELAKLAREGAPPEGANPLGGRNFQDLLTKETNAQANNTFFGESQQRLAGQEASERGYVPPTAPTHPTAAHPTPTTHARAQANARGQALMRARARANPNVASRRVVL